MARGVRGGSKTARDSQRKLRNRKQRKKWAEELSGLMEGKDHSMGGIAGFGATKTKKGSFSHTQRQKHLKSKLNIPKKMPETTKPDGSKIEPTTGGGGKGNLKSQDKAQQKVIDSKEYKAGRKKQIAQQKAKDDGAVERQDKMTPEQTKKSLELYNNRQKKPAATTKEQKPTKEKKSEPKGSNVHTRHYKTGKALGVMTRAQRRKYDKESGGKTFEEGVKATGDKSNKRETKYISSQRKKKKKNLKVTKKED